MTDIQEQTITCHFCFEQFGVDIEIGEDFTGHNTAMTVSFVVIPSSYLATHMKVKSVLSRSERIPRCQLKGKKARLY